MQGNLQDDNHEYERDFLIIEIQFFAGMVEREKKQE